MWRVPRTNVHPYLVFDETQYQQMLASQYTPINNLTDLVVKATTLNDLARVMEVDGTVLTKTVHDFNYFVESGTDYAFNRQVDTMRAFDDHPYLVFDETQYQQMLASQYTPINNLTDLVVKATTLNDLARVMEVDGTVLTKTVHDFNYFVESGTDYAFNRQVDTCRVYTSEAADALLCIDIGGSPLREQRRNDRAEILDANQQPIPHLYGAGELRSHL
ncbi:hypothetical protein WP50_11170 [Lactiplantibacillus plantarum]|nr:hypothetical protein WP50_11170 [Lactiplantibacillus plantarum]